VRADLSPGQQLAQSTHAAFEFAVDRPDITRRWRYESNFLVVVAVPDEAELKRLSYAAECLGIKMTMVAEPDYGDQLTALALEPGPLARKLCAEFPLALKGVPV
jgi:peptidyl-tRNA hydrolase